jgi:hypothetical protein
MAFMYPTCRTTCDEGVITIRPRGILRHMPTTTIRVGLGDVRGAVVKFERGKGYLHIKAEGQGLIALLARRQDVSDLVQMLEESGVSVAERKTFQRMRMP